MLILYETSAGYALFKLLDDGSLEKPDDIHKHFATAEKANKAVKLKAFAKFENTTEALSAVTALVEGKISKNLKSFLTTEFTDKDLKDTLAVADAKLGSAIAKKLGIKVVSDQAVNEVFRGIRGQLSNLIAGLAESDMNAMVLGLSHSLSRYKLKFSPDKVDTMIIQAIALLDDLDKELNTYSMRTIKAMGFRTNASTTDFSDILPEELETALKEAAEVSMGTEISEEDIENITYLCDQIISISEYRAQLYDYLKNRMAAIAPNLTCLVGELVGARLISHAGSLMNLSKQPASTVQILGAEKALFRALKSKHDTPKYGLIYHASLVGQAGPKIKGKIARTLATKAALAIRCDALGDAETPEVGVELRTKVENRLRQLEGKAVQKSNTSKSKKEVSKVEYSIAPAYNTTTDVVIDKKRKADDDEEVKPKKEKKAKKNKEEKKSKDEEKKKKKKSKE
ncbi:Nucleolar protein 58 [Boothiomyces sp. JEL0838]|nr:Nucleolar protein 58 [Boothiomyces sp. JEL0838]